MNSRQYHLTVIPGLLLLASIATLALGDCAAFGPAGTFGRVELIKTPDDGIQPQAVVDARGAVHLVYFKGPAEAGDIFYVRRAPWRLHWSAPIRVNTQPGSAVAIGTIRGAQLAVGLGGRVHVVWFGSDQAKPRSRPPYTAPLLYTRLNDARTGFEPQRNLMQFTTALDGGPSVAADQRGNVYVAWQAGDGKSQGETGRRLWVARSRNQGRTFSREAPAYTKPTGACACCSVKAFADRHGTVYILYRAATANVDRDMILLTSRNGGKSFRGTRVHRWKISTCPMSSEAFSEGGASVLAAWETHGEVWFARVDPTTLRLTPPVAPPGGAGGRKHPSVAANAEGETLLAWTKGTGWNKRGALAWQLFDRSGRPMESVRMNDAIPVWSLATAITRPDGEFTIIY